MTDQATSAQEEQILRRWTPLLLRSILVASVLLLLIGLSLAVTRPSSYYIKGFENAQQGLLHHRITLSTILLHALRGNPDAVIVVGLMVLTLVPLARVLFCLLLFLRGKDFIYVLFTAYVLSSLIFGIILGRVG